MVGITTDGILGAIIVGNGTDTIIGDIIDLIVGDTTTLIDTIIITELDFMAVGAIIILGIIMALTDIMAIAITITEIDTTITTEYLIVQEDEAPIVQPVTVAV